MHEGKKRVGDKLLFTLDVPRVKSFPDLNSIYPIGLSRLRTYEDGNNHTHIIKP